MPKKLTLKDWKERIQAINPYMDILNETVPKGTEEDPFICHCNKCTGTFAEKKHNIFSAYNKRKSGTIDQNIFWCPVCNGRICITGINDIETIRPDLVQFFVNSQEAKKYTICSNNKVELKCPYCNYKKNMAVYDLNIKGFSCPLCSDKVSFPNKICRCLMQQLPVEKYIIEYKSTWTLGKFYDCYFIYKNKQYVIEFDGEQHYRDTEWSTKKQQNENDNYKDKLAIENGCTIIRINCQKSDFEYIKNNILSSPLSSIFNLEILDWDLIYSKTARNLDIEIGEYYATNSSLTITELSLYFHFSYKVIRRALIKCASLGICDFSKEKVNKNAYKKAIESKNYEPFYLYSSDDSLLGEFKTVGECYEFLKTSYPMYKFDKRVLRYKLFTGTNYNGFKFIYKIGLKEYHKNNGVLYSICEYYNRTHKSYRKIALEFNMSSTTIYRYLITGNNIGICNYPYNHNKEAIAV